MPVINSQYYYQRGNWPTICHHKALQTDIGWLAMRDNVAGRGWIRGKHNLVLPVREPVWVIIAQLIPAAVSFLEVFRLIDIYALDTVYRVASFSILL